MAGGQFFIYTADFTNVGAGATGTSTIQMDTDADFIVDEVTVGAYLNAANGAAIAGTPLAPVGDSLIANNTMPTLGHVKVKCNQNNNVWTKTASDAGVYADLLRSNGAPRYLMSKPTCAAGDSLQFSLTNLSTVALNGQIVLFGRRVPKGQAQALAQAQKRAA